MRPSELARGASFAIARAWDKYAVQPRRRRRWSEKSQVFIHLNDFGQRFELDPAQYIDRHIFMHGIYERRFLDIIAGKFGAGAIALDIGANIGNHLIYLAPSFQSIHAFEPNPNVLRRLRRNIELNDTQNVVVHPVGLGNQSAVLPFRENNDGNLGASGFLRGGQNVGERSRQLDLRIEQADDYIAVLNLPRVDFIKIDVEGWEADVFEGMSRAIAKYRPVIAFEFWAGDHGEGTYERIVATLPGYIITEARYAREGGSFLEKLSWTVVHGRRPELVPLASPEARTYENVLAFPDQRTLDLFAVG